MNGAIFKDSSRFLRAIKSFFLNQAILISLFAIIIIMSIVSDGFLTTQNLINIARQISILGILAAGMTIVIIGKNIDLSIASMISLCSVVAVKMQPYGFILSVISTICLGLVCGAINGIVIGKLRTNIILTTLSTQLIFLGLALLLTKGINLFGSTENIFLFFGNSNFLGIPVMALILVLVLAVNGIVLQKTVVGKKIYAIGFNRRAALASGVNVSNIVMLTYIINGLNVAIASLVLASKLPLIRASMSPDHLFDTITIVVLGGTALSGGIGNMQKTALGLLLLGVINNSMALLALPFEYQQLAKGAILILGVLYDEYTNRRRVKK